MPVLFTVRCPTCHGNKGIKQTHQAGGSGLHDDPTADYPCPTCNCKGYLQKGQRLRTDKLNVLYRRITYPEMQCNHCDNGRVRENRRKKCPHCKGTRIKIENIILEFRKGKISVWEYLR